ncbi:MAG TPA: HAD family hydrolase [Dehalococcoidia bacterium]|nr:HAD family hydrolase [Dehalococcoidia bacterium]
MTIVRAVVFDVGNTLWFEARRPDEAAIRRLQAERLAPVVRGWGVELSEPEIALIEQDVWDAYMAAVEVEQGRGSPRDPSLPFLVRGALAVRGLEITQEQAEEWWRASWINEEHFGMQLYPDALDVLAALKAMGVRIGINTNRPCTAEMHRPGLDDVGIGAYVDAVVCSGDTGWYKPHPSTFELVLERLGAAPGEAAMVGDGCEVDMLGGKRAGMRTVWKLNGRYGVAPCPHADFEIHDLAELLSLPLFGVEGRRVAAESPMPHEDDNEGRW